jgi:Uma2 family endonuclease
MLKYRRLSAYIFCRRHDRTMITTAHFSLKHYEHMVAVGAFAGEFEKHVELLRGEIVTMSPIGPSHLVVVGRLNRWSYQVTPVETIEIVSQGPVRIPSSDSEPEPDLVWVIQRDYLNRHAEPHEVLLLVEVADSSLAADRGLKLEIYAEAGIAEYWIVNLIDQQIEVYRNPAGGDYQDKSIFRGDALLAPLALPSASLQPSWLLRGVH